jgi:hypothetical protein
MTTLAETPVAPVTGKPLGMRRVVYVVLAGVAALTSAAIWLLMIVDEERSAASATLEMVVKFTNLTVVLVAVVSAWIALGRPIGSTRAVAHLTVMVMAVVTALVNATLLDPGLPAGWWGVVDLFQHYVIPVAVVAAWVLLGPSVHVPGGRLGWILVVPLAWLAFVLVRGAATESYPYDFVDVAENGWAGVLPMVAAIVILMVALGATFSTIDRWRHSARQR